MSIETVPLSNHLLDSLPRKERDSLLADCFQVALVFGDVLHEAGDTIRHVHFPTGSIISLLTSVDAQSMLEVGMIGMEGMSSFTAILGGQIEPLRAVIQGSGTAWRIGIARFRRHLTMSPALQKLMQQYANVVVRQLIQTSACTRFHLVEARLARWLLMTGDRSYADDFVVTQEFLAFMLGVRRAGVTKAAGALQSMGLIHYTRGHLTILNRAALERTACGCYHDDLVSYERGLSGVRTAFVIKRRNVTQASVR